MQRKFVIPIFAFLLLFAWVDHSSAQVKRVQMHIEGYLCGN
jgi:hypothetical protein